MKKTNKIILTFLTGTALLVTACGDSSTPIKTVEECVSVTKKTEAQCRVDYEVAKKEHLKNAPKFNAKAECEKQFGVGNCETSHSGGGVFVPAMMGYLIGSHFGGNNSISPAYKTHTGSYVTPKSYSARTSTTTSRGGFGRSAFTSVGA